MFREDAVNIVYVLLCCALRAVPWCFSLAPLVISKIICICTCCYCAVFVCVCVFVYAHIVGL